MKTSMTLAVAAMDLSSPEATRIQKAVVDIKLLELLFKNYQPTNLSGIKTHLVDIIDTAYDFEDLKEKVTNELYLINTVSTFCVQNNTIQAQPQDVEP